MPTYLRPFGSWLEDSWGKSSSQAVNAQTKVAPSKKSARPGNKHVLGVFVVPTFPATPTGFWSNDFVLFRDVWKLQCCTKVLISRQA